MKLLMVCLGNICRSPLAEGVMKKLISEHDLEWTVDSAGTSGYHNGELPDNRSIEIADKRGIDIRMQRSRKLYAQDLEDFDLILAMDSNNYQDIKKLSQGRFDDKIELLLNYSFPGQNRNVPDPYYEGSFESVFDMVLHACEELIKKHTKK